MPVFQVVEGKQSEYYNHFADYKYVSCKATETRLMGAVAFCVTWVDPINPRSKFYQVFHLDYSEYGVDDYYEFVCTPDKEGAEYKRLMPLYWKNFTNVMGGKVIEISPEVLVKFIDSALPLADEKRHREYDNEENKDFRRYASIRLKMMREALVEDGLYTDSMTDNEVLSALIPKRLDAYETINYFIMRLIDLDFAATSYLTYIPKDELVESPLAQLGISSLIRSSIKTANSVDHPPSDGTSVPFRCKITMLSGTRYYFASFVIWLEANYAKKDAKVTEIAVGSINKLSDYEAAMQISQTEHITVFDCEDSLLEDFDGNKISTLAGVEPKSVPNGWLFTIYNKDNSHVGRAEYRLGDDVYGYALLTVAGEFVIMSHKIMNISVLDNSTVMSLYSPYMQLDGRYTLDTPVFHTLCQTPGAMFKDLIETTE